MQLLEHVAKAIPAEAGIPIPSGEVATTPDEAQSIGIFLAKPSASAAPVEWTSHRPWAGAWIPPEGRATRPSAADVRPFPRY